MKAIRSLTLILLAITMMLVAVKPAVVSAQDGTPSPAATEVTATVTPQDTPAEYLRPLVVVDSYSTSQDNVQPGTGFDLKIKLLNNGQNSAMNLIATFAGTDFLPSGTGGVRSVAVLDAGKKVEITQPMIASASLWGQSVGVLTINLSYSDSHGVSYSEAFTITVSLKPWSYSAAATATPTTMPRPQLIVGGYTSDVTPLQPGSIFNLSVDVRNLGSGDAKAVTMVLGGGANIDTSSGTPQASGMSGGSSELTTFAPLGSSNLVYLNDIGAGVVANASIQLIVNVTATPGAYPFKISFVYTDSNGARIVDDQVITLLIYNLPKIEVNYYRDPGAFFANQMNVLPLQVTNLGRSSAVMGNMTVSVENADISQNVSLVGALDPGGYFTLDTMITPYQAGPLDVKVSINYTDDFNQPQVIEQILTVDVQEMPVYDSGGITPEDGGMNVIPEPVPETSWQKVVRFIKGLFGLGSGQPETAPLPDEYIPEEKPVQSIPIPKG